MNELLERMKAENKEDGSWAVFRMCLRNYEEAIADNNFEKEMNYFYELTGFLWGLRFAGYIGEIQLDQLLTELRGMGYR